MHEVTRKERFAQYCEALHEQGTLMFAGKLLQRAARLFPHDVALICKDVSITFSQLYHHSLRVTLQLLEQGIKPKDRVCLLFENSLEYYIAYYGIWQTGAVVAPLNTFITEKELAHIINDSQPAALVVSEEFSHKLTDLKNSGLILPKVFIEPTLQSVESPQEYKSYEYTIPSRNPDDMAALLYTSGTTGLPKGVMLSSRNILTNVAQITAIIDIDHRDRLFGILPLFHSFAQNSCVWSSFFLGTSVIVIPKIERKWILEGFKHRPTVMLGVPTLYGLLCMMKHLDFSSVRFVICGGDALPDKIRAGFELVYRRKLCNGYGLTETSPFIAGDLDDITRATNTIGKPGFGISISLRDETTGAEVPYGNIGILWVKGDNVMLGYYNAPEMTKEMIVDGWLNTGDFAYCDPEGNLVISGRFKDLIIHKGFNIYPPEIENVLMSHPAVFKAGVIGKEDELTGEIPVAFVAVRQKSPNCEKELKELCRNNLAAYKIPRHIVCMSDLPMTALGKVDKKKLKKDYEALLKEHGS
jgi:long-chain acyl-CoA synthetase